MAYEGGCYRSRTSRVGMPGVKMRIFFLWYFDFFGSDADEFSFVNVSPVVVRCVWVEAVSGS
jgi:hypothetical protein